MIQSNIDGILKNIDEICRRLGKDAGEIVLVGVTKFADVDNITEAICAGLTHIGENKVQEAQKKFLQIRDDSQKVTKHMIGHLQTNKVKSAVQVFDVIQSVDSLKLAASIEEQAAHLNKCIDIFIQVNTAGESQKFGCSEQELFSIVQQVAEFKLKHTNS